MPERYGPWETAYGLFRQWQRDGVWLDILTRLQARAGAGQIITWDVSVDSTVCRAHQHAAGARKGGRMDPAEGFPAGTPAGMPAAAAAPGGSRVAVSPVVT